MTGRLMNSNRGESFQRSGTFACWLPENISPTITRAGFDKAASKLSEDFYQRLEKTEKHYATFFDIPRNVFDADVLDGERDTIDWCYIFYALNYQISAILLATTTNWYLIQSLVTNLFWMLPWAIAVTEIGMTPSNAWKYPSIIFGGSLVFSFLNLCVILALWAWFLKKGKVSLASVTKSV
ncbi:uncharacterized protein RAG0_09941 [Rhynchosporium agropyri]|uniref:Uncharacterized protein n=1 Tax=Rhynchosporium agropyri TaxID=914238 RepID=A0A1E1KXU8_9HELO|nr:uncharacterized protein RAG0_09941 [Rhynchosporium agropyri]